MMTMEGCYWEYFC